MKKTLLSLTSLFATSIIAHAQWTTSGTNIYNNNTGNVGIGTTNPSATLSVKGSTLPTSQRSGYKSSLQVGQLLTQDYNVIPQIGIGPNNYFDGTGTKYILNGYVSQMYMGANGTIAFSVYNSGTSGSSLSGTSVATTLANNGNLGIRLTNPQNKLDVNGAIHSKAVLIDLNGWADYVFKPTYQLCPLTKVKAYIDQNQHLSEIPSADEIAKDGQNLSEMNKLLMKNVEADPISDRKRPNYY
jgi:hypothetical protein